MVGKDDAKHVIRFAFLIVGCLPHTGQRRHRRVGRVETDLETDPRAIFHRQEVIDDFEPRCAAQIVDATEVFEERKRHLVVVAQKGSHVDEICCADIRHDIATTVAVEALDSSAELFGQARGNSGVVHGRSFVLDVNRCAIAECTVQLHALYFGV